MIIHSIALMEGYQMITIVIYDNAKVVFIHVICCHAVNYFFDIILDVIEVDDVKVMGKF